MKVFQTALQLGFLFVIIRNIAIAQIIPNNTVGTQITRGALNDVINGGTIRGNNLFHR